MGDFGTFEPQAAVLCFGESEKREVPIPDGFLIEDGKAGYRHLVENHLAAGVPEARDGFF